jgi:hypothetical protein
VHLAGVLRVQSGCQSCVGVFGSNLASVTVIPGSTQTTVNPFNFGGS